MKRVLLVIAPSLICFNTTAATKSDKPNLVFIFSDQQTFDMLGCYGNEQIITPHPDGFLNQGLFFTHAFSNSPVSTPFRDMLMTGLHSLYNGVLVNERLNLCSVYTFSNIQNPKTSLTLHDIEDFKKIKDGIQNKDPQKLPEYEKLLLKADNLLKKAPYSVMNKKRVPPGNDKHDYLSLAPYFWPNPDTPNGLPYIRKDGEVNPETRNEQTDRVELLNFFNAVDILGKAFFYSGKIEYAEKALGFINAWFLDPETKMNPHLNYGQGIPGVNDGRPFGIIEFGGIQNVITCLDFIEHGGKLEAKTKDGVLLWLKDYADWLQNSEIGKAERNTLNNHGNWYDVQLCSILLYLGDTDQVREILASVRTNRIATQIEPDGSQPQELARTKSFSYSTMNLDALTRLAWYGKKTGVDLWNFETADGRSIKKAYEFLIPYISSDKKWEFKQLGNLEEVKAGFVNLLQQTGKTFNEETFIAIAKLYPHSKSNQ